MVFGYDQNTLYVCMKFSKNRYIFTKLKMASLDTQENEKIHHRCLFHLIRAVWKLDIEVYALNPSSWKTLIMLAGLTGGKELYSWPGSALFGGGSHAAAVKYLSANSKFVADCLGSPRGFRKAFEGNF